MMNAKTKNPFERFLNLFTEVHAGEGTKAILLALNIFLIFTSYYIMKPVREALILSGGFGELSGAVVKSLTAAGQVILLMGAIPLYAKIASQVPRRRLINVVTIFFGCCLALFYILALSRVPLGVAFYLWIGIFNLMLPAQLWAFSNDLYTPEAGKGIFVIIGFGASLGAVLGGIVNKILIAPLGIYQLLLLAGGILLLSLIITNIIDSREKSQTKIMSQKTSDESFGKKGAFQLVLKNKYLLMVAFLIFLFNWVNTTGEYILGQTVENTAKREVQSSHVQEEATSHAMEKLKSEEPDNEALAAANTFDQLSTTDRAKATVHADEYKSDWVKEYIDSFYSIFYTGVNILGLVLQLFIVSRILKFAGIRIALFILPLIALMGYLFIIFFPILTIIRWAKTAENGTDYSLQNTVRHILFLPTTREEKYKAKQAIDTFFWRAGDLLSAALVLLGTTLLSFHVKHFALFNVGLIIVWLILAFGIGRENKKLTAVQNEPNNT